MNSDEGDMFNGGYSRIIENFTFFRTTITQENVEVVQKGLSKLIFVDIALDRQRDNPQRIFESLNSTGLELSQADLIRNYILMGLNRKEQKRIYRKYWSVIEDLAKEETLNQSRVSNFIRDFLTLKSNKIPNKKKVYIDFKAKYPIMESEDLEKILLEIKSLAKYYNRLINPKNEIDKDIRKQLEYINKLEINVAHPFLMKIYEDFANKLIEKEVFIAVLELIQSFVWRRFIVGLPTNALNKIFMNSYDKVDLDNYLFSIQKHLLALQGTGHFPRDKEVIKSFKNKDVYGIKSKNRTYLLERLENHNNKERVIIEGNSGITIEHIFPQNPNPKWKIELGNDDYAFIKENYLHTIGNLTLSGNNGKLGNKTFIEKRDLTEAGYSDSRLWLNKHLASIDKWDKKAIEKRFRLISKRFLEIWKLPDIEIELEEENTEVNIFDAEDPKFKKLEYAVFFEQKLEIKHVSKLYLEIFIQLFDLQPETFFTSDLGDKIGLTKKKENLRQAVAISNTYFIESNLDSPNKFDKIRKALTIFGFEDELMIKYAVMKKKKSDVEV